jgi:ABC-2 type transport system ATP-binding protein
MDNAIEIRDLTKRYGTFAAVDGISLDVPAGHCFGLLGPNGAGKTTTLEIVEGLLAPTSGDVRVFGHSWKNDAATLRQRIGIALQETQLPERLTIRETLRMFRSFYPSGRTVDEVIDAVELREKQSSWVMNLSRGQRQRLAIACALIGDPQILFLDEPTTGLDPQSRRALWDIVANYQNLGRTVVLTTHYMDEAEHLCQRVAVIDHGSIISAGSPGELISRLGGTEVIEITSSQPIDSAVFLGTPGIVASQQQPDGVRVTVTAVHEALPAMLARLDGQRSAITRIATHQASLEDVFVNLTGRMLRDDA